MAGRTRGQARTRLRPRRSFESKDCVRALGQLPVSLRFWQSGWLRRASTPAAASLHSLEIVLWLTLNDRPISLNTSPASLLALASATWYGVSLGFLPNRTPRAIARVRPSPVLDRILSTSGSQCCNLRVQRLCVRADACISVDHFFPPCSQDCKGIDRSYMTLKTSRAFLAPSMPSRRT